MAKKKKYEKVTEIVNFDNNGNIVTQKLTGNTGGYTRETTPALVGASKPISVEPTVKPTIKSTIDNSAIRNNGFNLSNAITDIANLNDAIKNTKESIPIIGNIFKARNIAKKTALNAATNMAQGALKTGEGVIDTLNDWSDAINNPINYAGNRIVYGKEKADKALKEDKKAQEDFIKRNLVQDFQDKTGYSDIRNDLEKDSLIKQENVGGQIAQGIGGMVPALLAGQYLGYAPEMTSTKGLTGLTKAKAVAGNLAKSYASQLPTNAILGASSYGSGVEEALNEGATREQARRYGLTNAAIEQGTEYLTGGIPGLGGKGGLDDVIEPLIDKNSRGYANALLKAGYGAFGEGLEEYTGAMLDPLAKKIYSDKPIDWKETNKQALQAGLVGAATGAILNSPSSIQDIQNARNEIKNQQAQRVQETPIQAPITKNNINTQEQIETTPTRQENEQINTQQVQTRVEPQTIETKPVAKLTQQEQQELDTLKNLPFELDEQQERRMDELLLKQNKDLEKNMSPVRDLTDVRDFSEVGSSKINAYQYDNPEVRPYFQEVAKDMLYDLGNSTKGERYMTEDGQFKGVKRNVPTDIAELLDGENGVKYSYKEIEDGLNAIIKDNGAENKAVAKRLEFYIDQRLRNGYMDSIAGKIPANNEYIETLRNKNIGENPNVAAEMEKENLLKVTPETLEPKTQEINNYLKENVPLRQGEAYSRTPQTAVNSMRLYENSPEISDFKRETLTHIVATDKAAKIDASEKYKENGSLENNAAYVRGLLQSDKRLTKNDKALAIYTMNEALKQGNKEVADNIISDLTVLDVEAGQWSQASKLMKQMTPLGQLETFIKMVQRSIDKGNPRFKNVKITQDMIDDVMDSYTDGKFDNDKFAKKMENFKQQVQEQMTPTLMDKFNSARMLGMLGAPKTHIRNLLANVGGVGLRISKNFNDRVAETIFIRDQSKRTHTFKRATPEIKNFVDEVVKSEKDTISGDKYTNNKLDFQKNMKVFNDKHKGLFKIVNPISKAMNGLSKGNSWLLEAEDTLFSSFAYKRSLQEFLTAQGMKTREDVQNNPKILAKGKDYALQQALESTYRQDSNLASAISNYVKKAESSKGSKLDKAAGIVIESNLPFKKTPINIAKSGIEYSPIGLVNGIYDTLANVSNGNMEMSQAIDEISKGVTGLGLLGIGALLAHNGFEIGAADDDDKDKKKTYDKLLGEQEYSVKIGDKYYDLSWMSPSAMPFFTGVELYQSLVKEKELDGNAVIDILSKTIDPLSSMSFLQGLSYTLKSYADSPGEFFSTLGLSAVENYVSQYLPTFLSQIASVTDSKQRTTSTSGDSSFSEGEKLLNQLKLKVPVARQSLPTKTDSWGRDLKNENYRNLFNAFINPSNTKTDLKDKTDKELERLYYSIGADDKLSSSALPKVKFDKYLTFKGEKYNLSNKELSEYKKTYGKIAKQNVEALLQTDEYKSSDDRQKAKYLESIYDYSNQKAKEQYGEKHNLDYDDYKVDQLYALVDAFDIPLEVAVTNKNIMDLKAEDGISGTKRKIAAVDDIDELDEIQKDALKRKFTMFMGNSSYKKRYDGTDVSYALNDALDYSDVSNDKINEIKRFLNIG